MTEKDELTGLTLEGLNNLFKKNPEACEEAYRILKAHNEIHSVEFVKRLEKRIAEKKKRSDEDVK